MKRFLSLLMAMVCLIVFPACAADDSADYTVAGKLLKQLWAGNGFSADVTLEIAAGDGAQAIHTLKPIALGLDYIYVRPTADETAEHRADLTLRDGENALSTAHLRFKDGVPAFQADVLDGDWYSFAATEESATTTAAALDGARSDLLARTGMPALSSLALKAFGALQNVDLDAELETYLTRVDLWIEGYRQSAVLGKLADGTVTMEVDYVITPAAIKAQVKQMVLDLLSDKAALPKLQAALGREYAALLLNPQLQSYYFSAIDALPIHGDMTVARTVSLKGDTLALHISLPLYDKEGGAVTLRYDRTRGEGDLPDDNTISMESDVRQIQLVYQEYSSLTDVRVVQGSLLSQPKGAAAFDLEAGEGQKALALEFTLRQQESEGKDEEGREVYGYTATLTVAPTEAGEGYTAVPETEATLNATFASKELKSAATEIDATLTVGGEGWDETITLALNGRTRKKWTPEKVPAAMTSVRDLTQEDIAALLPGAALRAATLLSPYVSLPQAEAQPAETMQPEATPAP